MKRTRPIVIILFLILLHFSNLFGQENNQTVITTNIDNFWIAYNKITSTKDSAKKMKFLDELFLEKGKP